MLINKSKYNKKNGFTLAEVLVTLLVIGVVAALTVPQLISSTNDNQLRVKYKKAFSDIQQATNLLASNTTDNIDHSTVSNLLTQYGTVLTFIKTGNSSQLLGTYKSYKGTTTIYNYTSDTTYPAASLSDGTIIRIGSVWPACSALSGSLTGICAEIDVDVNGPQDPNMVGRDYFFVWLIKDSNGYTLQPFGYNGGVDGFTCVSGSSDGLTSDGCSAIALVDGPMP